MRMTGEASSKRASESPDEPRERWTSTLLVRLLDALGAVVCALPLDWALALGRLGGELVALTQRRYTARIADHHAAMFGRPPASPARFARAVYRHYAQLFIEVLRLPTLTPARVRRLVDCTDYDRMLADHGPLGPLICTSGHWGNWEMTAACAALLGLEMHVVVRPLDDPALDRWLVARREGAGIRAVAKWNVVWALKKHLQRGGLAALLTDQHARGKGVRWVRYGARLAATVPTIAQLHLRVPAPIVVGAILRIDRPAPGGPRYRYHIVEWIDAPQTGKRAAPAAIDQVLEQVHDALTAGISAAPAQYLWTHRRWREPPADR